MAIPQLSLKGRIALVTGASRGIGAAVARALAAEGAHLILAARTSGALEELDDLIKSDARQSGQSDRLPSTLVPMDLKDGDAIDRLGAALFERYGRLDILIANAGILGPTSPLGHISPRQWDEVMSINLTANWRLIRALDPLLKRSDAGRGIFVTSGAASSIRAYWGPYAVSKAALDALVKTYAAELEGTTVKVNLLSPGATRTRMRAGAFPGEDPNTLPTPEMLVPAFLALCHPGSNRHGEIIRAQDELGIKPLS